ncbi:MAG: methyltransferase domain-containing protein [Pseudolabrys sp.]|nr:methyltransferase domain-containing protein [Pseudolabrys sp.]
MPAIFEPLTRATLDLARPQPGERVLDLACGTGIVARRAAPLVGDGGSVVGLDLRPGMIAKARSLPAPEGAAIDWREGDATALPFAAGTFDLVLCQQGLQFFPDRTAAAAEMRRVLADGGRAVLAVWRGLEHLTLFRELTEAEARHLAKLGVSYEEIALPFLMGDEGEIRAALAAGGFTAITISEATITASFPSADRFVRDVETAYASVMPQFVDDPSAFEAFVAAVAADLAPALARYRDGDGVRFTLKAHMAVAQ